MARDPYAPGTPLAAFDARLRARRGDEYADAIKEALTPVLGLEWPAELHDRVAVLLNPPTAPAPRRRRAQRRQTTKPPVMDIPDNTG